MNFLRLISQYINPEIPDNVQELAVGLCVLPAQRQRHEAPKKAKVQDSFIENKDTNTFGFHFASASRQQEGSSPDITGHDITLLKERGYWGKGKDIHGKNSACKRMWHDGKSEKETAAALGVSESWAEKRFGSFSTALLQEQGESVGK